MRVASTKLLRNGGYLHKLTGCNGDRYHKSISTVAVRPRLSHNELAELNKSYQLTAMQCQRELRQLAYELGLTVGSLQRLGVGRDGTGGWAFPMQDAEGRIVGIRLRLADGRKLSVKGGREGVFIPEPLPEDDPLLICEGPTDTAAMLDLGYPAIGRPSCTGGLRIIPKLVRGRAVVIVADGDGPGRRGADTLASVLRAYCPAVRIITPRAGIKDARAWLRSGATHDDVLQAINRAPVLRINVHA